MTDRTDRRSSPRVAGRFPVRYQVIPVAGSGFLEAFAEDLSADGVRFRCPQQVRVRSGLLLELKMPETGEVRSFGRAAWVRELPGEEGFEVGGRFVDQSTFARKTLERHLQR